MTIDRERALKCFQDYVKDYNIEDEKIRLKVEHTYRVCELCERIARESGFSDEDVEIAWLTGLLHDVGRFEQVRIYGTFMDAESIDHAQFGADILFKEGRIRDYIEDTSEDDLLEKAIRAHSAYRIPEDYTQREQRFAHLLRDADKIDILKVNIIFPLEEIYNVTTKELREAEITEEVFRAFNEEHAVLRSLKKTAVDHVVGHISLMYELVYPVSYRIVEEQGYLDKLMDFESECEETRERFSQMKEKMRAYLARSSRG